MMTLERKGLDFIRAVKVGRRWAYYADEVAAWYWVTLEEAARLGAMLADPSCDNAYSWWTMGAGRKVSDTVAARLRGDA
jgi:hypothetical protein